MDFASRRSAWSRRAAYPLWNYQVAIDLDHLSAVVDRVQHQSAAVVAPLTDRPRPLTTSSTGQKTFSDPAVTSYGSEGRPGLARRCAGAGLSMRKSRLERAAVPSGDLMSEGARNTSVKDLWAIMAR